MLEVKVSFKSSSQPILSVLDKKVVILSEAKDPNRSDLTTEDSAFLLQPRGAQMKIGELAKRANLNPSAICYYEKLGLLPAPARTSGQRRYSSGSLDRVLLIKFAGEMGFSLPEVKTFLSGIRETAPVGPRWRKLAERKIIEMRQVIARAQRLEKLMRGLSHCHCSSLRECVRRLAISENLSFVAQNSPRKRKSANSLPV